jgi:hypothetical protein
MIHFRDFAPADVTPTLAISRRYESTAQVVERANAWIASEPVSVLSVETLLLPTSAIEKSSSRFTDNMQIELGIFELGTTRAQVVRVWYQTNGAE